jgi:hypothetical protein
MIQCMFHQITGRQDGCNDQNMRNCAEGCGVFLQYERFFAVAAKQFGGLDVM